MAAYDMVCGNCGFEFELNKSIHDPFPTKCPQCKKHKLYQDYSVPYFAIRQDPKTLGHLAERNTEKMGKYELESARNKGPHRKEKPRLWYNADGKNLTSELRHLDTEAKKQNYILKGEL